MINLLILTACSKTDIQIERIIRLEDRRVACDSLLPYLESPEPKIRARAVEAMGKLQDSDCLQAVVEQLNDQNHNVRLEAAFALGQIGETSAEANLIEHLERKELLQVRIRVIEALGKIGTEKTFPVLIELFNSDESKLRAEAALSAGRMAWRDLVEEAMTDSLSLLLNDSEDEVRWKACYSLMRIEKDLDVLRLRNALKDRDPRVRMSAVRAIGKLQELGVLETLGGMLRTDSDWRVRVNAANALENYRLSSVANYLTLLNENAHVRTAIIQAIGESALNEPEGFRPNSREHNLAKLQLEEGLIFTPTNHDEEQEAWPYPELGAALISYAQLLGEEAIDVISGYADHPHAKLRARAMEALAETNSPRAVRILERNYRDSAAVVKIAVLNSLTKLEEFSNPRVFLSALRESDHVLVALAAKALSQDSLKNRIYAQPVIEAYKRLPNLVDAESAQMIFRAMARVGDERAVPVLEEALKTPDKAISKAAAEALEKITGERYTDQITPFTTLRFDFGYEEIAALEGAKALIKTSRGNIEFELFTKDAPLTVLNFARLAEKGFYDRLTFHRVVPNFVIQGGDPRGDSWGSPGYSIRSEFNKRHYLRGTVGMASAGKDTEGCQFFITHSPQPHLDGRYTVFGRVTSGMDVVDAIQEGDVMQLVTIRR
ncbi:hypothetical protein GWN42_29705 [candidate division KSB1 bacterium]|nr:hypothetical protein [candidate division KSB1 bacterium]NIU90887.1 hypothetical protein [candidate division KSB1 bacterium]NIV96853.1 hypothetical protein [candidate division KSB1 bacterium]NIW22802.1 hypothetical protein [candidate division KSB1 bacterium]NIW73423.1 hypothetical protein [candidate division KSB1 bacterium]